MEKSGSDLVMLINEVISEQRDMYEKRNQRTIFDTSSGLINTILDAQLMKMVLENLLENASKYSRENQTININLTQSNQMTIITDK